MIIDSNGMCTLNEEDYSYHSTIKKEKHITQADYIRSMTDYELAILLAFFEWSALNKQPPITLSEYELRMDWLDWLKSEIGEI